MTEHQSSRSRTRDDGVALHLARVLNGILFIALLAVMLIAVIPYGSVDEWWEAAFECLVFALVAVWMVQVLLRGSWQIKGLLFLLPLIILTAYAFFQTVPLPGLLLAWSNPQLVARRTLTIDRYQTHLTAVKMLALTLFTALLYLHTSSPRRFYWLVRIVIGIGLASALFGILRQSLQSPASTQGFVLPFLYYGVGYGEFISANAFAYVMEMSFGLLMGLLLGGGVRRDHVAICLAAAAVVWIALLLSNSRGGVLGMLCQSVFLAFVALSWYSKRRLAREEGQKNWVSRIESSILARALIISVIAAIMIAGVLWVGGDSLAGKEANNRSTIDGTTRREIWHSTWNLIKRNPSTGVGLGAYFLAIPEYQTGAGRLKVEQAHNDYLDLAASGGIVAIGLAGWFVVMILWRAKSSLKTSDGYRRAACLGALAGMLSIAVHSLVDFGLQLTGIAVLFAGLVVIIAADRDVQSGSVERFPHRKYNAG
jgi:O-antigen ligase